MSQLKLHSLISEYDGHWTARQPAGFFYLIGVLSNALINRKENQMAKLKKDEAAAGEHSVEKKAKKQKKSIASDIQDPTSPGTEPAADGVLEKKVVLSPIAVPLADAKLKKRTLKLVKKAAQGKQLKRGVREVVKALRKGSKGWDSHVRLSVWASSKDDGIQIIH